MSKLRWKVGDRCRWVQQAPENDEPDDSMEEGEVVTVIDHMSSNEYLYSVLDRHGTDWGAHDGNLAPLDDTPPSPDIDIVPDAELAAMFDIVAAFERVPDGRRSAVAAWVSGRYGG